MLHAVISLALIVAVLAVYSRVATHEFISLDDPIWITDNERVQQGLTFENIPWAFQVVLDGNWVPLTWLSHMAVVEVFGVNAGAHLLINVVLHALNSMLLFLVLAHMTRRIWPSASSTDCWAVLGRPSPSFDDGGVPVAVSNTALLYSLSPDSSPDFVA